MVPYLIGAYYYALVLYMYYVLSIAKQGIEKIHPVRRLVNNNKPNITGKSKIRHDRKKRKINNLIYKCQRKTCAQ